MPDESPATALPPVPLQFTASQRDSVALEALARQARADLERINVHDEPELAATRWYVPPNRRERP